MTHGFTLIEIIVAIAITALASGLATVAFRGSLRPPKDGQEWATLREGAHRRAVEDARSVVIYPDSAPDASVLFLPDGRVLAEGIDPLTGRMVRP